MNPLTYAVWAVLSVALGGGIIGLGLALCWFGLALIAWERTRPEVMD